METDPTYPINLITLYLAGEARGDDLVFLETWLKADPGNRELFEEMRRSWLLMEKSRLEDTLKVDVAWQEMEEIINEKPLSRIPYPISRIHYQRVLRIAAVILVLAIPSFFAIRFFTHPVQKEMEASLTIKEGTLPDGTSVTLNKGAVLQYPSTFKGNKRNVKLNGEAWFEVKHEDSKPFIITNNNVRIEVLGTSFYVNTKTAGNNMEVILNSGSVAIYFDDQKQNSIFLSPGEKAEINPGEQKIEKDINTDQNYRAWMTQRFIYNNTPLINIVADLNKVYHANLRITTPSISYCLVTATFDHQSVESILHVIQATLDLKINTQGTMTDISGKKCN